MKMIDLAKEATGMDESDIVCRLCPSELGMEEEEEAPDGSCRQLNECGGCRQCWNREMKKG